MAHSHCSGGTRSLGHSLSGRLLEHRLSAVSSHFRLSLEGIADLVKQQRPDIFFLGDMGSSRDQIGRLRQRLEAELDDEWFLWTDISAPPGYPVGMGAVILCSLAQYIRKVELPCPLEANREVWRRAVEGRLMQLEVSRPEFRIPWRFIGIYQHVA